MKFFAIAAIAIVAVSAEECPEGECWVVNDNDEKDCTATETVEADDALECWVDEEKSANALLAGAATLAVAATMTF